jgi:TATA-binding protein-associated factor Taf7
MSTVDCFNSILSGSTSRAQTPALQPDEESNLSTLNEDSAKTELMKVLAEATSSSEEEEEEEVEITVEVSDEDESSRNPEVFQLNQAIQDLDMQIEEQKMKIETTKNHVLRTRFENFLLELERHKQEKIDELQNLTS